MKHDARTIAPLHQSGGGGKGFEVSLRIHILEGEGSFIVLSALGPDVEVEQASADGTHELGHPGKGLPPEIFSKGSQLADESRIIGNDTSSVRSDDENGIRKAVDDRLRLQTGLHAVNPPNCLFVSCLSNTFYAVDYKKATCYASPRQKKSCI